MSFLRKITIYLFCLSLFSLTLSPKQLKAEELDTSKLHSQYIYLMDGDTGQTLFTKDGDASIYPASMTKMMTAILAIEHFDDLQEKILITNETYAEIAGVGASLAGFSVGDHPTIEDLLYGTLMPSGAECAQALAIGVAGSIADFVTLMNTKALEIGMTKTHFTNPTGLHNDDQYSTCRDMAVLLNYCRQSDLFTKITTTYTYDSSPVLSHVRGLHMEKLLIDRMFEEIPGFEGGKSGYTPTAGRCLASSATINGVHYILATAKSRLDIGAQTDAIEIYEWAASEFKKTTVVTPGELFGTIPVIDAKEEEEITIQAEEAIELVTRRGSEVTKEVHFVESIQAPAEEGESLGSVVIKYKDEVLFEKSYYLDHAIEENDRLKLERFLRQNPLLVFFYGSFVFLLLLFLVMNIRNQLK